MFSYGQEHQVHTGKFVQNCLQQDQSAAHHDQYVVQTHQERGFKGAEHQVSQSQKLWVDNSVGVPGLVAIFQQHLSLSNLSDMARESRLA